MRSRKPSAYDFYLNDVFICDYLVRGNRQGARGAMQTPIIDTHLHLIYRDRLRYPWLADVALLNRDFPYETYAVEARRCGVSDAVHMEVDVAPDRSRPKPEMSKTWRAGPRAFCVAPSARVGRKTTAFPPSLTVSWPIHS